MTRFKFKYFVLHNNCFQKMYNFEKVIWKLVLEFFLKEIRIIRLTFEYQANKNCKNKIGRKHDRHSKNDSNCNHQKQSPLKFQFWLKQISPSKNQKYISNDHQKNRHKFFCPLIGCICAPGAMRARWIIYIAMLSSSCP